MDIESKSEWLLGYEMRLGEPLGIFECARLGGGHGGRLEDSDQVVRLELSDLLQIITCRFRKTPCLKPTTGIGVTIVNEHERSQSRLLATGGKEQSQIKASAKALADDFRWKTNLLPAGFKACRRIDVTDA